MFTISSGITKTKDSTKDRIRHNLRLEKKHRNIENTKTNFSIESETEFLDISEIPKSERKATARKTKENYENALEENFKLLQKSKREGSVSRIERKSRLQPITEGVVNFGGVYDMKKHKLSEIKERTIKFNKYIDDNLEEVMKLVYKNLQEYAKEVNTEITDLVLHRDERGLYHFHYLIKTYDLTTGQKLNFKHDINKVGIKLQTAISQGFEKLNIHRVEEGKSKKIKMTKEQLIEYQEAQEEIIIVQKELEELKNIREEYQDLITQIENNILELSKFNGKSGSIEKKLKYILTANKSDKNILDELEKLLAKSKKRLSGAMK